MHPTQHTTITPRMRGMSKPEGRMMNETRRLKPADEDIIRAIRDAAAKQSSGYIYVAALREQLNLSNRDLEWLRETLTRLDLAGRICLSPVELMARLAPDVVSWHVRNGSGIPCHEVCLSEVEKNTAPPVMTAGDLVRAASDGLQLMWLNQPRHRPLLERAAKQASTFTVRPAPMPQTAA